MATKAVLDSQFSEFLDRLAVSTTKLDDIYLKKKRDGALSKKFKKLNEMVKLLIKHGTTITLNDDGSITIVGRTAAIRKKPGFKQIKQFLETWHLFLTYEQTDNISFYNYYRGLSQNIEASDAARRIREEAEKKTQAEQATKAESEQRKKSKSEQKEKHDIKRLADMAEARELAEARQVIASEQLKKTEGKQASAVAELEELNDGGVESMAAVAEPVAVPIPSTNPAVEDPQGISAPRANAAADERQEGQIAVQNLNPAAVVIAARELAEQEAQNERVNEAPVQVDVLEDNPDPVDFFSSVQSAVSTFISASLVDVPLDEPEETAVLELPEQRLESLTVLSRLLVEWTDESEDGGRRGDIVDQIIPLLDNADMTTKDIKTAKGVQKSINTKIKAIKAKLRTNRDLQFAIDARRRELTLQATQTRTVVVREELKATEKALALIKERLQNDSLVNRIGNPSPGAEAIVDAIDGLTSIIDADNVVGNEVIDSFVRLWEVVSFDTQQVFIDVLRNTISDADISGAAAFPQMLLSHTLMRFLTRAIYAGSGWSDYQREQNIDAFLQSGATLEGRNLTVVSRFTSALGLFLPEPPPVPRSNLRRRFARNRIKQERKEGHAEIVEDTSKALRRLSSTDPQRIVGRVG